MSNKLKKQQKNIIRSIGVHQHSDAHLDAHPLNT